MVRLRWLCTIVVVVAVASCADHNDPDLNALVVSADEGQICVSISNASYKDLNGCYPVDPHAPVVKAGDCIAARFPNAGTGPRSDAPLSRLKILDRGCGA